MTNSHVLPDSIYAEIDPGIRFAVRVLNAHGVETDESCEGGPGHACHEPTVFLPAGTDSDGFAALAAAVHYGLPVNGVAKAWDVKDGLPYQMRWRITFRRPMPERADERPMFVWHYEVSQ